MKSEHATGPAPGLAYGCLLDEGILYQSAFEQ